MEAHYFIGIKIPAFAAAALEQARSSWGMDRHKRYTAPEDMHLTLLFIGNVPHEEIAQAAEALKEIDAAAFELTMNGISFFGNPGTPRIVYAAVEESEALRKLQANVKEKILKFQMNPDLKPFVPHITLAAKWKGGPPIEPDWQLEPLTFPVDSFAIFRIAPGHKPKYIEEYTYHLKEGV
ncbi:RNA 2',3'-cyclic phosphodiesterase [Planococcus ruber]|uniref:RNA 2',3'-cyclic phosphodiesterase n=1 Tax=Planococcus ruber TaxID=2027871 RepID=UPI001FEED514|nr:RNA 2',3'-cyclic phosphodiesterase [Planococcus ruber]MCJ1908524.1 RNA 2',3'-cyclic phosphodiesterase [Planococcus ruber]